MSNTDIVTLPETSNAFSLTRFMPRDLTELVKFSEYASKSGVFGTLTASQALIVMLQGAELGINPLQSLREIPLVNGKPRPSATLVAGLIQRSPLCEDWHIASSPTNVTLTAKRKGRGSEFIVNVRIEDVPAQLRSKDVWKQNPEDMLVARAIHRMARRAFADILAGIQDPDEIDETRVIDVARVERATGLDAPIRIPHTDTTQGPDGVPCNGPLWLTANRTGGAFLRCEICGATQSPPQEARDAMRGTPEHLTIAGAAETVLEPGERVPTDDEVIDYALAAAEASGFKTMPTPQQARDALTADAPDEPVDAAAKGDTIGAAHHTEDAGEREDAPIPEPADPPEDSPKERHQAMRNAIYAHWSMPRPTPNKIEMRGLLEEFGWDGGSTLGDWMLGLDEMKLAAIADAVAGIA